MTTMLERSEEMVDKQVRGKYTLEYKLGAIAPVFKVPSHVGRREAESRYIERHSGERHAQRRATQQQDGEKVQKGHHASQRRTDDLNPSDRIHDIGSAQG